MVHSPPLARNSMEQGSSSGHAQSSSVRSRILKESINANRKGSGKPQRRATWTKKPKYQGQSTLDLRNGLAPLRPSNTPKSDPPAMVFTSCHHDRSQSGGDAVSGEDSANLDSALVGETMLDLEGVLMELHDPQQTKVCFHIACLFRC